MQCIVFLDNKKVNSLIFKNNDLITWVFFFFVLCNVLNLNFLSDCFCKSNLPIQMCSRCFWWVRLFSSYWSKSSGRGQKTKKKKKKPEINNSLPSTHQRRYLSEGLGDYKSGGDGDYTSAYPLPTLLPLTKELERALPLYDQNIHGFFT